MAARSHLSTVILTALATLAGCAGDAPKGDGPTIIGGGGTPTASQVIDALGTVECDEAFGCKASYSADDGSTFTQAYGADVNACYADEASYYDAGSIERSITAGTIEFDGDAAADCMSDLATDDAPSCDDIWTFGASFPASCDDVFAGVLDDGDTCTNDFECAGDSSVCTSDKTCGIDLEARTAHSDRGLAMHPKLARLAR